MISNPEGLVYDVIFIVIFLVCVIIAANRGAFRAVAGIAGTVAGVILGSMFQGVVSPAIAGWLHPLTMKVVGDNTVSSLAVSIRNLGMPAELQPFLDAAQNALASAEETARTALAEKFADFVCGRIAPLLSFLLIFFLTKLAISLVCSILSLDIPVLSTLNEWLGALIGAGSGLLILLALSWGIWRFSPDLNIPVLSRAALQSSLIGGFLCRLFV
jgi:Colicin V production protein.